MGRYGIGARVRHIEGASGTITGKRKGERLVKYDALSDQSWTRKADLTVLPCSETSVNAYSGRAVAEGKWVPKVGDRVRVVDESGGGKIGDECIVTEIGEECRPHEGPYLHLDGLTGGNDGLYTCRLEPVVDPATTTTWAPVAGKFGKTRDGRKVGPAALAQWPSPECRWSLGTIWLYRDDGTCGSDMPSDDLVAEWVEPAVAVVEEVAVAEATATPSEPERKFKVGDVVNYIDGKGQGIWQDVTITKDTGSSYYATCPKEGEGAFKEEWLEPAAPPAKFKVGDRVVALEDSAWAFTAGSTYEVLANDDGYVTAINNRGDKDRWFDRYFDLAPTLPIGSKVTFTATGRLSAINDNGHMQVVFKDLAPAQNSFALPAAFVTAA